MLTILEGIPTIFRTVDPVGPDPIGCAMQQSMCQQCKKAVATVHFMDIVGPEKREKHLCERCAGEDGYKVQQYVPLNELLTQFVLTQSGAQQMAQLTCPECGTSFAEFRNVGLLGCPHDYDAFDKALVPLLQRAHEGATHHVGKTPRGANGGGSGDHNREIARLRRELEAAIASEDFERAAKVRDDLRAIERP